MRSTEQNLFELISSVVLGKKPSFDSLSQDEIVEIYKISRSHNITHLSAAALINLDLLMGDEKAYSFFEERLNAAMFKRLSMQYSYEKCCLLLEEEGIDHIPLKGAVLRELYPEPWMRVSVDIDILVRPEDHQKAVEALVNKLGFKRTDLSTPHDVTLKVDDGTNVEMHFDLIEDEIFPKAYKILSNVWQYAIKDDEGSHRYRLEMKFTHFYHLVHLAKHMKLGGGGIKDYLDLYLLYLAGQSVSSNEALLKEGGILSFATAAEQLSRVWFGGEEHNDITRSLSDFVMSGGLFRSRKNTNILEIRQNKSKLGYYISRLFVPYDYLKKQYPIIERKPYLTPFYEMKRLWNLAFGKKRDFRKEIIKSHSDIAKEEIDDTKKLFKKLEL